MVKLILKNIKEIEKEYRDEVIELCESKSKYYENLFKKYEKDLTLEVHFDHTSSKLYKVNAKINLKSKKVSVVEEGDDIKKVITELFAEFKKTVKKQYELERKDYEYKRKRK